jgi:iron uptake system EfeUOB component EfeO/EfeM
MNNILQNNSEMKQSFLTLKSEFPAQIKTTHFKHFNVIISKFSFMLIGYDTWNKLNEKQKNTFKNIPSTLIINKKTSRFN